MFLCLKCYVDKEDNLLFYANSQCLDFILFCIQVNIICLLSKPLLAKLCTKRECCLCTHTLSPLSSIRVHNTFPICGISPPLLKYITHVLYLNLENSIAPCFVPLCLLMMKQQIIHNLLMLDKLYLWFACLICEPLI